MCELERGSYISPETRLMVLREEVAERLEDLEDDGVTFLKDMAFEKAFRVAARYQRHLLRPGTEFGG